jgi:hypothetical protein
MVCALALTAVAGAQPPGAPIACWWRTGTGAVAVGEPLDVVLTCSVSESRDRRVVVDESRLGADAIQLAPFEVLDGEHPADLRRGERRFLQYRYRVRLIDADAVGRDVALPDVRVPYRIETLDNGNVPQEGRERELVLPAQTVRVLSLVPADAQDIREPGGGDLAAGEALRFRARMLRIAAVAAAAMGVVLLIPAVATAARRAQTTEAGTQAVLSRRTVLRQAIASLTEIQQAARTGWTDDLMSRAAQTVRIVAACAIGQPVSQRVIESDAAEPPERLVMTGGLVKRRRFSVAAPTTTLDVTRALQSSPAGDPGGTLEDLADALRVFTIALYRAAADREALALDAALGQALSAARRVRPR